MKVQSIFTALNISASGLSSQRKKLDVIASNIANANTTRTETGGPYRRQIAVMETEPVPDFERLLRKEHLPLKTSHKRHFPFKDAVRAMNTEYQGVKADIQEDPSNFVKVYDPNHPDADEDGFVSMPNVNIVSEMVDMISASRSYEANLSSIDAAKRMAREAMNI